MSSHAPANVARQLPVSRASQLYVPGTSDVTGDGEGDVVGLGLGDAASKLERPSQNPAAPTASATRVVTEMNTTRLVKSLLQVKIGKTQRGKVRVPRFFNAFLGAGVPINDDTHSDNGGAGLFEGDNRSER